MPHRTFFWFIFPPAFVMFLFIFLPIVPVITQSLCIEHEQVIVELENCGPFGCTTAVTLDTDAMARLNEDQPLGRFNGLGTYTNRSHLAVGEIAESWRSTDSLGAFWSEVMNLPLYKALAFTLI